MREEQQRNEELLKKEAYLNVHSGLHNMDESVLKGLSLKKPKIESILQKTIALPPEEVVLEKEEEDIGDWCMVLAGNARIDKSHIFGEGELIFSTLLVYIQKTLQTPRNILSIYYEVQILSKGIIQLGWAHSAFQSQFTCDIAHDNGVGDDSLSFAYDGSRGLKWNSTEALYGRRWSKGDIIGCELKLIVEEDGVQRRQAKCDLIYYVNGISLETAFSTYTQLSYDKDLNLFTYNLLTPAISLDGGEEIVLNVGQSKFKHSNIVITEELYPVKDLLIQDMDGIEHEPICQSADVSHSSMPSNQKVELETNDFTDTDQKSVQGPTPSSSFPPVLLEDPQFDPSSSKASALAALERLGLDHLKAELIRRGLKCGGSLSERASRLLSVRGMKWEEIETKLKANTHK